MASHILTRVSRSRPIARDPASRSRLVDAAASAGIIAVVLPLYLATLYPDVVASGDSAKFQYLGKVLGTAHPPGYPLYIFVSHLFSYVPLGTLAWRMNLLSAVAGVLTSLCTFAAARRLGAGVAQSAGLAVALATGLVFWNKSLAAEVYTLGALLLMFAILAHSRVAGPPARSLSPAGGGGPQLRPRQSPHDCGGRTGVPRFVFSTDARRATRPRVLLASAVLLFAGIAQYGYILLRTWQHAPYVEARADTLAELYGSSGRRVRRRDVSVWMADALTVRIPLLGAQLLRELTVTGAVLVCAGAVAGSRFRPREWILVAGLAGAILALTANVDADTAGFAAAALPPLWLLAAFAPGMQENMWRGRRAIVPVLVTTVLVFTIGAEATANFRYADHSDRTIERRLWSAVFEAVPDRTAVIAESYVHDQGLLYMLAGEGVGAGRQIELVQRDADALDRAARIERRMVVAFEDAVRSLSAGGFEFVPLRGLDWPIPDPSPRAGAIVS